MPANSARSPGAETAVAALAWAGLVCQMVLIPRNANAVGISLAAGVGNFLSYFTILTNFSVAVSLTIPLAWRDSALGAFFVRPTARGAIASYIAMVGIVYSVVLRELWNPQGLQWLADVILHDAVPVTYVLFWIACVPKGTLQPTHVGRWLVYPLVYMAYSIVRGAFTGWYPYPFADVSALGYLPVLSNTAGLIVAFAVLGLVVVGLDRLLAGPKRR